MGIWDSVIDTALDIGGAIFGSLSEPDPVEPDRTVQPRTTSVSDKQGVDFIFDDAARTAMKNFTTQLQSWTETDRNFFEDKFMPFQESLISTNMGLLENISKNSNLSLEQSIKDLTGGDLLKNSFRASIADLGGSLSETASRFAQELDKLPTEAQRIGQAISSVEQQFGNASAEIKRNMRAQGINITQATERDLAIQKATAKAGAVGAAGEAARRERTEALAAGTGVFANLQAGQSAQLQAREDLTQRGVGLGQQVGGVQQTDAVSGAAALGVDLTRAGGEQVLGTKKDQEGFEVVQPGVTKGVFRNAEGEVVDSSGEIIPDAPQAAQPVGGVGVAPGGQATFQQGEGPGPSGGTGADSGQTLGFDKQVNDLIAKYGQQAVMSMFPGMNLAVSAIGKVAGAPSPDAPVDVPGTGAGTGVSTEQGSGPGVGSSAQVNVGGFDPSHPAAGGVTAPKKKRETGGFGSGRGSEGSGGGFAGFGEGGSSGFH